MRGRRVDIIVNGKPMSVVSGSTVAAALLNERVNRFRESVVGESRGPVCGMGICYECRVTINDVPQQRACLSVVEPGMRVDTGAPVAK
jgi:sarcosine oxidase subunit alpha